MLSIRGLIVLALSIGARECCGMVSLACYMDENLDVKIFAALAFKGWRSNGSGR